MKEFRLTAASSQLRACSLQLPSRLTVPFPLAIWQPVPAARRGSASAAAGASGSQHPSQHIRKSGAGPRLPACVPPMVSGEPHADDELTAAGTQGVVVYIGGLPVDATGQDVTDAFASVGRVLTTRLTRLKKTGDCKGFGYVELQDSATAERACQEVKQVCGQPVGVHIASGVDVDQAAEAASLPEAPGTPSEGEEASISKLLGALRSHTDKHAAVQAAFKAVMQTPQLLRTGSGSDSGSEAAKEERRKRPEVEVPSLKELLDSLPKCKQLLETFRASPNMQNKTPLAIVHEYASRFNLELVFEEEAESSLGPFSSTAKLTSVGGTIFYASGKGRGRGKKDAKQLAAAALLEELLGTVDRIEFLMPGKPKHLPPSRSNGMARGGQRRGVQGRFAFMQGLARGSQAAYAAGYDLGATMGMQIRPPAPGSFQHPFGNSPSPMNPGLQSHPSHHQQMAAPMDLSSFLPAQNGYEDASQDLQSLLRAGASPMDLGIPQLDIGTSPVPNYPSDVQYSGGFQNSYGGSFHTGSHCSGLNPSLSGGLPMRTLDPQFGRA